ncbi:MAG: YecA family protein [Usitatibacter sp.]
MKSALAATDLDRLEDFLVSPGRLGKALALDALQGFLCAVVSSPSLIAPSRWVPVALGEGIQFDDPVEASEIMGLLAAFHQAIAEQVDADADFQLIIYGHDGTEEARRSLELWTEGYLIGVSLADPSWQSQASVDDFKRMILPFYLLSGRMKETLEEEGKRYDARTEKRLRDETSESLPGVVMENRRFWQQHR